MKIPKIKDFAAKMLFFCIAIIGLYLVGTAFYGHFSSDPFVRVNVYEMLHSAALAAVISLGGGVILDFQIRQIEG
ncbi:MAG: hypothetical protein IJ002_07050 [Clostridia bacterium]|nr:hypothetical protein [Clostridia bacterium]